MTFVRRGNKLSWLGLRIRRQAPRLRRAASGFGGLTAQRSQARAVHAQMQSGDVTK
jgi:hypothetical protein